MRVSKKDDMRSFAAAIKYCISLSWETSPLYTFLRGLVYLATAFLPFASMYASKRFIDILAAAQRLPQAFMNALLLPAGHLHCKDPQLLAQQNKPICAKHP